MRASSSNITKKIGGGRKKIWEEELENERHAGEAHSRSACPPALKGQEGDQRSLWERGETRPVSWC